MRIAHIVLFTLFPATALTVAACSSGSLPSADASGGDSGAGGDAGPGGDEGGGSGGDEGGGGSGEDSGGDSGGDSGDDGGGEVEDLLADAMSLDGLMAHLEALDAIGLDHDDTRQAGSEGYSASTGYVIEQLESWGYTVEIHEFDFFGYSEDAPAVLRVDGVATGTPGTDYRAFSYSEGGSATGELVAVDLELPPSDTSNHSTSGCSSSDYSGFPEGGIALVQRGTCTFSEKVAYAADAGAAGVILFNEGQPGRQDLVGGYLSDGSEGIPVLDATFAMGEALAELEGQEVSIETQTTLGAIPSLNLIVETAGGDPDHVLMVGGHLDSVSAGPGVNDNGSGTATVLEIARAVAETGYEPEYRLRFAWWGAEEVGLLGSEAYVEDLSSSEADAIIGYLNYDMVGSPNGARFVYDGDGDSTSSGAGPSGSDDIEEVFEDWFEVQEQDTIPTAFDGRSDYGPFIWSGIPAGGLFSGAEGSKSAGEADLFGGVAGTAYDSCYHQDCDTLENLDEVLLVEMARAAAHATEVLSRDPILVDGGKAHRTDRSPQAAEAFTESWTRHGCGPQVVR